MENNPVNPLLDNQQTGETIVAQATPAGRGGVAIVRISGALVKSIMSELLGQSIPPRHATYLTFLDVRQRPIDQGIALYFKGPHSFTGEDVLELHGHGGPVVIDLLIQRIVELGARIARPGEFSERAFLNDKIDLTQAEAIADLIEATSAQAARSAVRSLQGEFSNCINEINAQLIHIRTFIEAAIDFSDENIEFLENHAIIAQLKKVETTLAILQQNAAQGALLKEGITIVLAGPPNVGKSSLLNCLAEQEVAIVTPIAGTTRDLLRERILLDGVPLHIIDTAGLRESTDLIEQEGIRRARQEIERADLVLLLSDAAHQLNTASISEVSCPRYYVRNKIDLMQEQPSITRQAEKTIISISAKSGAGIELLKQEIKKLIGIPQQTEGLFLARRRHLAALANAYDHIQICLKQLNSNYALELAAEEIRLAHQALNEITGKFTPDDLLGNIFASFCIGK